MLEWLEVLLDVGCDKKLIYEYRIKSLKCDRDPLKQECRLARIACSGTQLPTHLSEKFQRPRSYYPQSFECNWYKKKTLGETGILGLLARDGKFYYYHHDHRHHRHRQHLHHLCLISVYLLSCRTVMNSELHVLHQLLPAQSEHRYNLRPRPHNLSLSYAMDHCNFIPRLAFKDTY